MLVLVRHPCRVEFVLYSSTIHHRSFHSINSIILLSSAQYRTEGIVNGVTSISSATVLPIVCNVSHNCIAIEMSMSRCRSSTNGLAELAIRSHNARYIQCYVVICHRHEMDWHYEGPIKPLCFHVWTSLPAMRNFSQARLNILDDSLLDIRITINTFTAQSKTWCLEFDDKHNGFSMLESC